MGNSSRPAAWRLATQLEETSDLLWGAARKLLAKWKKNSRAQLADLLPLLSTGEPQAAGAQPQLQELQAGARHPLQGAPVLDAVVLTVRDEAALTSQHIHDPPAGGGCDRPHLHLTCGRLSATWREETSLRECCLRCPLAPPSNV